MQRVSTDIIAGPSYALTPAAAWFIAPVLTRALAEAHAAGEQLPPDLPRVVNLVAELAKHHRPEPSGTHRNRSVAPCDSEPIEWVSAAAAARISGTTERNIRKRCERKTLEAEKVGGTWRINRAALR